MRLTKKLKPPYERVAGEDYVYTSETRLTISFAKLEQKLGQKEDDDEELGIDSHILFKALKNGVYYRMSGGQIKKDYVYLIPIGQVSKLDYSFMTYLGGHELLFADYGKTWALTRKELEK